MTVLSGSYSKLTDFEKCKKYFWLKHDERIPEPQRPLPPGKTELANDRGTRVHQSCEDYVTGKDDTLCFEAEKHFGARMDLMRILHKDGIVSLEGEWGFNSDWETWAWGGKWMEIDNAAELGMTIKTVKLLPPKANYDLIYKVGKAFYIWAPPWLRMKLDAVVFHSDTEATVIDYKTGRKFGNEVKHGEQVQLYQLATFLRYPKLQTVHAELWYLDQDEVTSQKFSRAMGMRYREKFTKRIDTMLECDTFPPNPNKFTCKWCMYGPWGSGDCPVGVR